MKRRRVKLLISLITLLVLIAAARILPTGTAQQVLPDQTTAPGFYKVTHVIDGDTIAVRMNNTEEKIRMIGVDTPETHKPDTPVQCYGPQASDFSTKALQGQNVRLEADPLGDNRDRYDRLLRYVYLPNGTLWDQQLIEQGYGFAYLSFPFSKADEFAVSQDNARNANRGVWAACHPFVQGTRWQSQ